MPFDLRRDEAGTRRWRSVVENGQTVATSGESFASKGIAKRAIESFKRQVERASGRRRNPTTADPSSPPETQDRCNPTPVLSVNTALG
jgi:uncharacterized protein